ncbi:MAG TPA: DUF6093 family protein, partial [Nocardioidaceae bacterium]|nr:DUF6093 family protein [Nocardioidaceae bacterium]
MSIDSTLAAGRAAAESLLTDTCRITYEDQSGEQVWDATTATYVWPTVTVYEGPCRIPRRGTASTSTADAAGQSFQVGEYPFE